MMVQIPSGSHVVVSIWQVELHPSPDWVLPSSHGSPASTTPFPHFVQPVVTSEQAGLHVRVPAVKPSEAQVWPPRSAPSHGSAPSTMPSPQRQGVGSYLQLAAQPGLPGVEYPRVMHVAETMGWFMPSKS